MNIVFTDIDGCSENTSNLIILSVLSYSYLVGDPC
jgi:hypothetical protein